MKKILLGMALLTATAVQAMEDNDTTIINNAHKVMVITNDSLQQIKVVGKDEDKQYVYENLIQIVDTNYVSETRTYRELNAVNWKVGKKDQDGWSSDCVTLHFGLGVSNPTNVSNGIDFRPFSSWEAMIWAQYEHTPKHKLQTYSVGLGFTSRSYGIRDDKMFWKGDDGVTGLSDYPIGSCSRSSHITIASLSIPFLFKQKFGHKSHYSMTLCPVVNFTLGGTINTRYEIDDYDCDVTTKKIGHRPVTVDFMGIFRAYGFGFYVKYSPMSVLKTNRGPEFRALSFGLYL